MSKKTKKCPLCGTAVDVEQQHCPNCPHSFFAEEGVQEYRRGRSRQHYVWIVAAAVFCLAVWRLLSFVMKFADDDAAVNNPITQAAQQATVSTQTVAQAKTVEELVEERLKREAAQALAHGRVQVVPSQSAAAAAGEPNAAEGASQPGAAEESASRGAVVISHGRMPVTSEPPAKEWRLRGCVYDLVTLKPVPHATLVIKDAELDRRFELVTGADGRYKTVVPSLPNRGYVVSVEQKDYAQTYLDPETPDVREKPAAERREIAQELTHALDAPHTVQGWGKKPVITDFYLAPLRQ